MKPLTIAILLGCTAIAHASTITFIPEPDAGYTASTTLLPVTAPEGSVIGALSDGTLEIDFFSGGLPELMQVDDVPDSWATWGAPPNTESGTPIVLASFDDDNEILFQFNQALSIFGMELEPDDTSAAHDIMATFLLAGTPQATLTLSVDGNGGALLFAAAGGSFDAVDVVSDVDFAGAEFRYEAAAPVPEPSTAIPIAGLIAGFAIYRGRSSARYKPTPHRSTCTK